MQKMATYLVKQCGQVMSLRLMTPYVTLLVARLEVLSVIYQVSSIRYQVCCLLVVSVVQYVAWSTDYLNIQHLKGSSGPLHFFDEDLLYGLAHDLYL
jgi:hypothetical protein